MLRGGWGITYAQTGLGQADGGSTLGAGGWNTINFQSPAFGEPGALLRTGLVYSRDDLFRVTNNAGIRPSPGQVDSPPQWIHPDAGKMPKLNQWSISLQREITRDLVVDVAYVGNRGDGFTANNLININAISNERLTSFGLDLNNAADRTLLTSRLDSPVAASRGFNRLPYAGYSGANTVAQSLRPFPQFGNIGALGVPLGESKYDSLQVKANKRYSHGLNLTATFTWQNERTNMGPGEQRLRSSRRQVCRAGALRAADHGRRVQLRGAGVHEQPLRARSAGRMDVRRHGSLRERHADSGAVVAESDRRPGLPEHDDEPRRRGAAVS